MISRCPRVLALLMALTGVLAVAGCGSDAVPVVLPPLNPTTAAVPVYDDTLQPAATVMAVVPESATTLGVTDFTQVRLDLGLGEVTGASSAADRAELARKEARLSPQLSASLLTSADATLRADYGFGADDVAWQASWIGPDGSGYAIKLDDDVTGDGPARAAKQGVGTLGGSTYYPSTHVFLRGGTLDPTQSWRADPDLTALVGQVAAATYVNRGCVSAATAFNTGNGTIGAGAVSTDIGSLDTIDAFSVSLGADLATVELGSMRTDVFDRAQLADQLAGESGSAFDRAFTNPVVADPSGGRIGYVIGDPRAAAQVLLDQRLPFAVCAA